MPRIVCPSCGMSASKNDYRQLIPVGPKASHVRSCRNCGEMMELTEPTPRLLAN